MLTLSQVQVLYLHSIEGDFTTFKAPKNHRSPAVVFLVPVSLLFMLYCSRGGEGYQVKRCHLTATPEFFEDAGESFHAPSGSPYILPGRHSWRCLATQLPELPAVAPE